MDAWLGATLLAVVATGSVAVCGVRAGLVCELAFWLPVLGVGALIVVALFGAAFTL